MLNYRATNQLIYMTPQRTDAVYKPFLAVETGFFLAWEEGEEEAVWVHLEGVELVLVWALDAQYISVSLVV